MPSASLSELGEAAAVSLLAKGNDPNLLTCGLRFASLQQERPDLVRDDIAWFSMGCLPDGSEDQRMIADARDIEP
jgi:hypothetical protein